MQQHRVRRQVLEIQLPQEDAAREVHHLLGRIQRDSLESIINACCSEVSSPDRLHRIEKLELNLGTVTFAQMEDELPRSLQTAMRHALSKEIQSLDRKANAGDRHPATQSQLELLAIFARSGALPWWADSKHARHVPESLEFLLNHAPDDLAALLRDLLHHPQPLRRIVLHCDDELLLRVFDALAPSATATVKQQLKLVFTSPWWKTTPAFSQARNALWIATLTHASWATLPATLPPTLLPTSPPTAWPSSQPAPHPATSPFWLRAFETLATRSPQAFETLLSAMHQQALSAGPAVVQPIMPIAAALVEAGRLHGRTPEVLFAEIADWLQASNPPSHGASAFHREGPQAAEDALRRNAPPQPTSGDPAAPAESSSDNTQPHSEPTLPPSPPDRGDHQDLQPLDLRFADADAVYIENSGLVILWPFLERFFERLQLLHEKKFIDPAAQHRAAGLLQYLATEDPSPPEYQMLLNKMLCGLSPDDLLEIGPPITEAETQECISLLSAAIANAPVLRNMSHEGFRGSFLLRKGALSARDGSWLLRVERETFDIVLDRFPWSFGWIKLPWMEVPLGVEW